MSYMRCPRCGLSVRIRAPFLTLDRCPRCIAKQRVAVAMTMIEDRAHNPPPDAPAEASTSTVAPATTLSTDQRETSVVRLMITPKHKAETVILVLTGDLDIASAPMLKRHLDDAATTSGCVVIDLSDLEFLDSTGLQLLWSAQERLLECGHALRLRRGRRAVQRVFELTHTVELFQFED